MRAPHLPDEVTLPRDNGELVFSAPWEARAVAMAVTLIDELGLPWDAFRTHLIDQIAKAAERPYYESWAAALEAFIVEQRLTEPTSLDEAEPTERAPL